MRIEAIVVGTLSIPLVRPFITAIRQTEQVEDVIVQILTDAGNIGYGNAAITPLITGDSKETILDTIKNVLAPLIIGQEISNFNYLLELINNSIPKNTSAKAAIDIALHDLFAQACKLPLYRLLGGNTNHIKTGITVSAKNTDAMMDDISILINQGFTTLKLKVGVDPRTDLERIKQICANVDSNVDILIDANQGWGVEEGIGIISALENLKLNIKLFEQPVKANDIDSLKKIRTSVNSLIVADEACFSPQDTLHLIQKEACGGINIKLMKSGGIYNAKFMYNIATAAKLKVMVGCMLESPIGIAAIASFAVSNFNILFADLDPIALIKTNPVIGGARLHGDTIYLSDAPGLGITGISNGFCQYYEVK